MSRCRLRCRQPRLWPTAQGSPLEDLPLITDPEPAETTAAAPPESGPFVTETMAELYLKQGHTDDALRVYRALLEQRPGDSALQAKIASLQSPALQIAPSTAPAPTGPTIREVLTLVAARRPGHRPDGHTGNGSTASTGSEAPAVSSVSSVAAPAAPAAPATAGGESSHMLGPDLVGAFFGNKPVADADDAAARTLALAFSSENGRGASSAGGIAGTPARVAARELSLDAVFASEQAPASPSSFSFDQFFSQGAATDAAAPTTPSNAESQDDVAQFTSWLQGLKRK